MLSGMPKKIRMDLNGTHQHLVYADYVTILETNINIVNENAEALLDANEPGLEANTERSEYMFMSHH
jgi:hypothetical protein